MLRCLIFSIHYASADVLLFFLAADAFFIAQSRQQLSFSLYFRLAEPGRLMIYYRRRRHVDVTLFTR
jgi:hypothetical protein